MNKYMLVILLSTLPVYANAGCVGTEDFKSCTDASGNHYTVNKFGDQTIVNGSNYNTGNTWSQTSTHLGDMTITNGRAADGGSWNSTSQRVGDMVIQNGTDSDGNSFNNTYFDTDYDDDDY